MISGISAARNGLHAALTRFERAAGGIARVDAVSSPEPEAIAATAPVVGPAATDFVGAQVDLMSARLSFSASLIALRASTNMIGEVLTLGGYGVSANDQR